MTNQPETRALLERTRQNKWEFYRVIEPHRPALYKYCRRLTGNPFDGEDLHQESVLRAFAKLSERFEALSSPRAYLFRIATNLWVDWNRRESKLPEAMNQLSLESVDASVQAARSATGEMSDGAKGLLQHLPAREASAFLLREVFEFSVKETATLMSCSEAAAKVAAGRAKKRLAALSQADREAQPSTRARELAAKFATLFKQRDISGLLELIDEHAHARVLGCAEECGRDEILRGSLHYALRHSKIVDVSVQALGACCFLAIWYEVDGKRVVKDLLRVSGEGSIEAISFYYFSPDVLSEVCDQLNLPYQTNGYAVFERGWWNDHEGVDMSNQL